MTNRKRFLAFLGALISTLDEEPTGSAPDGICYAGLMARDCSYDEYTNIRLTLVQNGLLTVTNDTLTLTGAGRVLAKRLMAPA